MLEIPGAPALSAFRIAKLLDRLSALEPAVRGLAARFVHFADLERPLTGAETAVLARLLTYGPTLPTGDSAAAGERVLIVPRAGTISPWSSKATDIVQVCGLTSVRRVERGIEYRLRAARALGAAQLTRLAPALFDRMTEMALLDSGEVARLFGHAAPKPYDRVARARARGARGGERATRAGALCG